MQMTSFFDNRYTVQPVFTSEWQIEAMKLSIASIDYVVINPT